MFPPVLSGVRVRLISGISLSVGPGSLQNVYQVHTEVSDTLTSKYQVSRGTIK